MIIEGILLPNGERFIPRQLPERPPIRPYIPPVYEAPIGIPIIPEEPKVIVQPYDIRTKRGDGF